MDNGFNVISESIPDQEAALALMDRLYDVAAPESVFSTPVEHGEYTVITASEVSVGLGYGYGGGGASQPSEDDEEGEAALGYGAGGGGGGAGMGRPVAVIEIGPNGVRVEPIVDPTKIMLAFFTAFGAMFMMLKGMRQQARG